MKIRLKESGGEKKSQRFRVYVEIDTATKEGVSAKDLQAPVAAALSMMDGATRVWVMQAVEFTNQEAEILKKGGKKK